MGNPAVAPGVGVFRGRGAGPDAAGLELGAEATALESGALGLPVLTTGALVEQEARVRQSPSSTTALVRIDKLLG